MAKRNKQLCPFCGTINTHQGSEGRGRIQILPHVSQILPKLFSVFLHFIPKVPPWVLWVPTLAESRPLPQQSHHPEQSTRAASNVSPLTSHPRSGLLGHSVTFTSVLKRQEGHCWQKSRCNEFYVLETEKLNYFNLKVRAGRKPTEPNPLGEGKKQNKTKQAG